MEIEKIQTLYADTINQKNILINNKIPKSTSVQTDVTVLQTILRNLISNAIKFSYPGGNIKYLLSDEKDWLELKIMDQGIGIDASKNEEETADSIAVRQKAKGTGIGLKICQELAIRSNLKLSIIPRLEGGTVGIIRFRKGA